jgi:hypothetical protein
VALSSHAYFGKRPDPPGYVNRIGIGINALSSDPAQLAHRHDWDIVEEGDMTRPSRG